MLRTGTRGRPDVKNTDWLEIPVATFVRRTA
jgi:hypothetical protein